MNLLRQHIVGARDAHELRQLLLLGLDLFAQHLDLALDQRDGRAVARMLQSHACQQLRMMLEEIGVAMQVLGNCLLFDRLGSKAAHLIARHPAPSTQYRFRFPRVRRRPVVPGP